MAAICCSCCPARTTIWQRFTCLYEHDAYILSHRSKRESGGARESERARERARDRERETESERERERERKREREREEKERERERESERASERASEREVQQYHEGDAHGDRVYSARTGVITARLPTVVVHLEADKNNREICSC